MTVTSSQVRQSWLNFLTVIINSCVPGWNTNCGGSYKEDDIPIDEKYWSKEEAFENAQLYLAQVLSNLICRNRNCIEYEIKNKEMTNGPSDNLDEEQKNNSNSYDYLWNYMYKNKPNIEPNDGLEDKEPICLPSFQGIKILNLFYSIMLIIKTLLEIYKDIKSIIQNNGKNARYYDKHKERVKIYNRHQSKKRRFNEACDFSEVEVNSSSNSNRYASLI